MSTSSSCPVTSRSLHTSTISGWGVPATLPQPAGTNSKRNRKGKSKRDDERNPGTFSFMGRGPYQNRARPYRSSSLARGDSAAPPPIAVAVAAAARVGGRHRVAAAGGLVRAEHPVLDGGDVA